MPSNTFIRAACDADADALAHLSIELGYPTTAADIAARLRSLGADPAQCVRVAATVDGGALGWIHAAAQLLLESGPRCEVLGLVVSSTARGQGLGRQLLQSVEQWARECRMPVVSLRCNVIRHEAHGFYEHMGYQRAKTQHAFRKVLAPEAAASPMA